MIVLNSARATEPPLNRLARRWQELFGFDVFISYKWSDGAVYAETLKSRLEDAGLVVFLDRDETPGGVRVRGDIRRNLLRARALVVVASPDGVAAPDEITPEIDMFTARHPKRPLLGIEFDGELEGLSTNHPWHPYFQKPKDQDSILWHKDGGGREALARGELHPETVGYVVKSRSLLGRRRFSKMMAMAALATIVFLTVVGVTTTYQRLEEGRRSVAQARGFEALERSQASLLEGLLIAFDSLSIRDMFAGRRAAMTFWAQTPRITAASLIYLRSPRAIRELPNGGYDVIGSGGFSLRIEPDLSIPRQALEFKPGDLIEGVSDSVTAAAANGTGFVLGMTHGNVIIAAPDTGQASCIANQDGAQIRAATVLDSPGNAWLALGVDCADCAEQERLVLRSLVQDISIDLPLKQPRVVQTIASLPGRNCLLVSGKDWDDGNRSLSLVELEPTDQGLRIAREAAFVDESRFDLSLGTIAMLPDGWRPYGPLLGVIDDSPEGTSCGGEHCRDIAIYALDTKKELARHALPRLAFVSFLSGDGVEEPGLVLGDYDGNSWHWDLDDALNGETVLTPLLQARPTGRRAGDLYWRNEDPLAIALSRPDNRVLLIGQQGSIFEIALPDGSPRFGKRIEPTADNTDCTKFGAATMRQTTPERRRAICQSVEGKPVTAVVASEDITWVFLENQGVELLDVSGVLITSGQTPATNRRPTPRNEDETAILSTIFDGIIDPGRGRVGSWVMRSDGTLLYITVDNNQIVSRNIAYGHGAAPIILGDVLVSFAPDPDENEIKVRSLADGRIDFDDRKEPITTIPIDGEPLAGLALPDTGHVFIAVRWNGGLAFELVDIERRRSLSPPVSLSIDDAWGTSTHSVFLSEEPSPGLAKARISIDRNSEVVHLITPRQQAYEIPMARETWQKSLSNIVRWQPELGAAEALGFAKEDYPLRPGREVAVQWSHRCDDRTPTIRIPKVMSRSMLSEDGAGLVSGDASASAAERLRAIFPDSAPGCPIAD